MKEGLEKYFGGTDITLEKLKEKMPIVFVDGTHYKLENWLKECEVFDKLVPDKSKVFIPYGGTVDYGYLKEVVWEKEYLHYQSSSIDLEVETSKSKDWWVYVPYLIVKYGDNEFYVYEVSFYKNWKRKTQMKHLETQSKKPKRKFLSLNDIALFKKEEAISNSKKKTSNK